MNLTDIQAIRLEGIIAAGKSTLLKHLKEQYKKENYEIDFIPEPVTEWSDFFGHDLLAAYYNGQISHAVFQLHILCGLTFLHQKRPSRKLRVVERSVSAGRYVFLELLKEENSITQCEYLIIKNIYQEIMNSCLGKNLKCDLTIYMRTDPRIAFDRMMRRGRKAEQNVTLTYLEKLQQKYDAWLIHKVYPESQPKVKIVNSSTNICIWNLSLKRVIPSSNKEDGYSSVNEL